MRISDYIASELSKIAVNCYTLTGGGAMHLNDAFSKSSLNIRYLHHEQSCSMAAEAEARISNKPAIVNVTSGPGGINAINGVFGAYTDSIPMIVVSGQVKRETLVKTFNGKWRQLGDQEVDIVSMVKGVTKYSVCLDNPILIKHELEKAIYISLNGRPGPVWLDVPIDIQAMQMDFNIQSQPTKDYLVQFDINKLQFQIKSLCEKLKNSKRPVFYLGAGVHISDTKDTIIDIAEKYNIPIITSFNSNDLIPDESDVYVGRAGSIGNRSGNFVVQSSDLLIVLGSRLNIRQVSYNWKSFAPNAFKVGVDIDELELDKPTCKLDLKIHSPLQDFMRLFNIELERFSTLNFSKWLKWGKERLLKYPVCLEEYWDIKQKVNPYCFVDELFKNLNENEIVVCADGTACVTTFQGMKVKKGQRVFHNSGCASMGYDLPASIGSFYSSSKGRIICLAGDGSIMLNLQELETIRGQNLPIQIFILNNEGYHSIRQTQKAFFSDNISGCGLDSGLTFPNFSKIANAFDFDYFSISNHTELKSKLPDILNTNQKFICEIFLDLNQHFSPKLTSKKLKDGSMVTSSMEDMWPFLEKNELKQNLIK